MEMVMHLLREFDKVPARISFPRRYSGFDRRARGEQYTAGRRIAVSHMSGSLRRPLHGRVRRVSRMSEECLHSNVQSLCRNLNVEPYLFDANQTISTIVFEQW